MDLFWTALPHTFDLCQTTNNSFSQLWNHSKTTNKWEKTDAAATKEANCRFANDIVMILKCIVNAKRIFSFYCVALMAVCRWCCSAVDDAVIVVVVELLLFFCRILFAYFFLKITHMNRVPYNRTEKPSSIQLHCSSATEKKYEKEVVINTQITQLGEAHLSSKRKVDIRRFKNDTVHFLFESKTVDFPKRHKKWIWCKCIRKRCRKWSYDRNRAEGFLGWSELTRVTLMTFSARSVIMILDRVWLEAVLLEFFAYDKQVGVLSTNL